MGGSVLPGAMYIDIVLELHPSRAIKLDLLQRLSHDIIRLPFGVLCRLDHRCLVQVPLVVKVEAAECILQTEDLVLLKLRKLPERHRVS